MTASLQKLVEFLFILLMRCVIRHSSFTLLFGVIVLLCFVIVALPLNLLYASYILNTNYEIEVLGICLNA